MKIRFGTLALSLLVAVLLWGMARGTSEIERGFDIPVVFDEIPEDLVITGQSTGAINIRVRGNAAALRNISSRMEYIVDVSDSKAGVAIHEVEASLQSAEAFHPFVPNELLHHLQLLFQVILNLAGLER